MVTGIRRAQVINVELDGSNNMFMHNSIVITPRDAGPGYQNYDQCALYIGSGSKNQIKNNVFVNQAYNSPQIRVIWDYWGTDTTNVFDSNLYFHSTLLYTVSWTLSTICQQFLSPLYCILMIPYIFHEVFAVHYIQSN